MTVAAGSGTLTLSNTKDTRSKCWSSWSLVLASPVIVVCTLGPWRQASAQATTGIPLCAEPKNPNEASGKPQASHGGRPQAPAGLLRAIKAQTGLDVDPATLMAPVSAPAKSPTSDSVAPCISSPSVPSQGTLKGMPNRVGKVIVQGAMPDAGRGARYVISRVELDNPDRPLAIQALARAGGIAVSPRGISMLGMNERATRILVDGRRPPVGFSLNSLRSVDVDRIEYSFGSDPSYPGAGVAGTVNFIMRRNALKARSSMSISLVAGDGEGRLASLSGARPIGLYASHNLSLSFTDVTNEPRTQGDFLEWGGRGLLAGHEYRTAQSVSSSRGKTFNYGLTHPFPDQSTLRWSVVLADTRFGLHNSVIDSDRSADAYGVSSSNTVSSQLNRGLSVDWQKRLTASTRLDVMLRNSRNTSNATQYLEYFALPMGHASTANSASASVRNSNELDTSLRFSLRPGVDLHAGANVVQTSEQRTMHWRARQDVGSTPLGFRGTALSRHYAAYLNVATTINESTALSGGVRLNHVRLSGESGTGAGGGPYDLFSDWIEPSVTWSKSGKNGRRTVLSYAHSVTLPTANRLIASTMPVLQQENLPLFGVTVAGLGARNSSKVDTLTLSTDWVSRDDLRIFTAVTWRQFNNMPSDRIFLRGDTWFNEFDTTARMSMGGVAATLSRTFKSQWPVAGSVELRANVAANRVLSGEIGSANALDVAAPLSADLSANILAGAVNAQLTASYRDTGKVYLGPGLIRESDQPVNLQIQVGWRWSRRWAASVSVGNLLAGTRRESRQFSSPAAVMVNRTDQKILPTLMFQLSRSVTAD